MRSSGWATEVFLGSDVLAGATVSGMRVVKCDLRVHPLLSTRALTTEREASAIHARQVGSKAQSKATTAGGGASHLKDSDKASSLQLALHSCLSDSFEDVGWKTVLISKKF